MFGEFPQLFNVLVGEMSLIGPRPLLPQDQPANSTFRLMVRPGITGWAQINGSRGGNELEDMKRRLELDLEYLKHWSLSLDLLILLRTVTLLVSDARAY